VAVQKVLDALVTDAKDEITAALKAGRITSAQADQLNANVVQHVTDRVNSTAPNRSGGPIRPAGGDIHRQKPRA
jgi:hypothetical protein